MAEYQSLDVNLPHAPYSIYMGAGLLNSLDSFIPDAYRSSARFFICDDQTEPYARQIAGDHPVYVVPSGEQAKSMSVFQDVLSFLLDFKVDRKAVIFAVGGGVVGDLAGYASASVMRGTPFVQVPTTLLAMVDSSVGGKTGINMPQGKNLVGAFHQPISVICDFDVLKTLPERELRAGYAEILKYALLGDANFYDWLEENGEKVLSLDPEALAYAVKRSCEMKAEIVIADEKETSGRRALLNLGHTFGHAFEAVMKYDGRLLHGEGVAVGMLCAMELSVRQKLMDAQNVERVAQHIQNMKLKKSIKDIGLPDELKAESLLSLMYGDKKVQQGRINFVLMKRIGEAFLTDEVEDKDVLELLQDLMKA